jgi:hypothetical protein
MPHTPQHRGNLGEIERTRERIEAGSACTPVQRAGGVYRSNALDQLPVPIPRFRKILNERSRERIKMNALRTMASMHRSLLIMLLAIGAVGVVAAILEIFTTLARH